jgi:hypothetical protein
MAQALPLIVILFKCSFSLVKKVSESLQSMQQSIEWLDAVAKLSNRIAASVDQLGSSVYEEDIKESVKISLALVKEDMNLIENLQKVVMEEKSRELSDKFVDLLESKLRKTLEEILTITA